MNGATIDTGGASVQWKSIFSPGNYTSDLCKCGHHEGDHDWENRCNICNPCIQFEQAPGISMLESAEEYAQQFIIKDYAPGNDQFIRDTTYIARRLLGQTHCTCTGGIPMMKRDCPRHGHLVRRTR